MGGAIELSILRGQAQPLRLVDIVHRTLDFLVGVDVGDGRCEDGVAERGHGRLELALDGERDLLLGREDVIQLDLGHRGAHDVEDVRLDLLLRVGQAVVRILDRLIVGPDLVLHGNADQDEHVILGLRLAGHLHLLQAHRHGGRRELAAAGNHHVEARVCDARKLAELLDERHGTGVDLRANEPVTQTTLPAAR